MGLSLHHFIEHSPIAICRITEELMIAEANESFHRLTRQRLSPLHEQSLAHFLNPGDIQILKNSVAEASKQTQPVSFQLTLTLDDKDPVIAQTFVTCIKEEANDSSSLILHLIDLTEQKNLEMRFSHSQKMQAVGQLAGGVAHDFNNLLTAMIGFCDLLLMRHPAGDPSFADIMQIKQNANRAANLVRQLLAFSRRQTLQPKVIDLTDVLAELSNLIRRLIGENIELHMLHGRDLGYILADQGQLEQVIINLAVNARDAMPEGGSLRIESRQVTITQPGLPEPGMVAPTDDDRIEPGVYVLVEVEDSGTGIPAEVLAHIFEPFFSTKEIGSGTGLGLSTVYGIIKQSGGYVFVTTKEGKGTRFNLYFKRHHGEKRDDAAEEARLADLTGGETVLLVEDETPVRIFAARALRNKGYEVLEADSGEHAIEVFEQHLGKVELIITDVMMPGMNGPKMVQTLETNYPDEMQKLEIIFISGYAEDAFADSFGSDRQFNFLPKPFTLKQLAAKVKEVITAAQKDA